ncbi:Starch-binding associating with outer membrane [Catalinimonas alkaloidigena]|uniref:Starch-binding associating with outer membrane n=1 Tax=Catalinimonas alkaloidigena TaxID=1075417 RepID=A0A1G9HYD4_9BACT|nr:RagB/SusD family nutrient uptake outer membrane protein [Catalinimonas alkaloidigena]SDL17862.1 Starch-binding associating with outer membrane [Catalinimonas alkaloidigena]
MKKILYTCLVLMLTITSCQEDFLDVQNPSVAEESFVFSSTSEAYKVLVGCYDIWHSADGPMFYATQIPGSDAETHPETYSAQDRHIPEGLFATEFNINWGTWVDAWSAFYTIINRVNLMMEAIEGKEAYQAALAQGAPSDWTQLYGEAATFRATMYFYLIRYWGDVPYFDVPIRTIDQTAEKGLDSRFDIYDAEIAKLREVEPLMYHIGEGGMNAERFTRTFAQAMIGRMALSSGGYQLFRTDFDYGSVSLQQKGTEQWNAIYARRSDYQEYMQVAIEFFRKVVDSGAARLITTDERGEGFNNPFQRHFQHLMDLEVSPESIYEVGVTRAISNSEFPYAFGRPSGGGGSNSYPNKSYGQSRIVASFYYGEFSPKDMRRDVTAAVTANSGNASEKLISFEPGSRERGGLANNKLDESRMENPYIARQRQSGVNWVQLRMADVILKLAYAYAMVGDDANAKMEFAKVRSRAFRDEDQAEMVTDYINSFSGEELADAIMQERKLELAGEGHLRWDMIITGKMPERIVEMRDEQEAMVQGLKTQGYYTFPETGVTISNYIWTKMVNMADYGLDYMLTTQAPADIDPSDPLYPVLYPGWRGNSDKWTSEGFIPSSGERNMAIQGLYRYIDPDGIEAAALEAAGYEKQPWGINIVNNEQHYTNDMFKGYPDAYYDQGVPPRYMAALSFITLSNSNGNITQGYGHAGTGE